MAYVRIWSVKLALFALIPVFALLLTAEMVVRVKYFIAHKYDWPYLTTPFGRSFSPADKDERFRRPDIAPTADASQQADASQKAGASQQMVFKWQKPCADGVVYSSELHTQMPRTFDDNCFRGDRVAREKDPDEYRIVFIGGSTVEDVQSDEEMMTAQFKHALPWTPKGKRVTVVNAGRAGFESRRIAAYWGSTVGKFSPDLALYYEAWNEQPTDAKWTRVDDRLGNLRNELHRRLYYRSMLYTYAIEKSAFLTTSNDHFWKIDTGLLRSGFAGVTTQVRASGARLVFVTQVVRFPRTWKGVDTFDYRAVDALLDRLKTDQNYVYDVTEISALNQRLAVALTIDLCRQYDVPVINILDDVEALGEGGRAEMFMDLGHLTVKGDKIVGGLIASRLPSSN